MSDLFLLEEFILEALLDEAKKKVKKAKKKKAKKKAASKRGKNKKKKSKHPPQYKAPPGSPRDKDLTRAANLYKQGDIKGAIALRQRMDEEKSLNYE